MKFVIAWISFINNELHQKVIEAENEQEALLEAFEALTDTPYFTEDFDTDNIKQAAFDCDGMISAIEI